MSGDYSPNTEVDTVLGAETENCKKEQEEEGNDLENTSLHNTNEVLKENYSDFDTLSVTFSGSGTIDETDNESSHSISIIHIESDEEIEEDVDVENRKAAVLDSLSEVLENLQISSKYRIERNISLKTAGIFVLTCSRQFVVRISYISLKSSLNQKEAKLKTKKGTIPLPIQLYLA